MPTQEEELSFSDDFLIFDDEVESTETELPDNFWKIMIVDDDPEVHNVTKMVLSDLQFLGKKVQFISAYWCKDAKKVIAENQDTAMILLDVVMEEDDSGLQLAKYIREELKNDFTRIILRTGQPGQAPEEEVILKYDINDYKTKTELTSQKLFTSVITSLRAYHDIISLDKAREDLAIAKSELEEMNQIKNIFLSNMNHELRTPLNGILGFTNILEAEIADPRLIEYLNIIKSSGNRLLGTLTDIIDLVNLESGNFDLKNRRFFVLNEVKMIFDKFQRKAKEKQLNFSISPESPEVTLCLDSTLFLKVIENIVSNAFKFTEKGDVTITVTSNQDNAIVKVSDTGVGIDEEFIPHVFDSFNQEDYSFTRKYQGSGIGLTIARKFNDLLGGKIEIESKKNKGTTVTVSYPLKSECE